jgi:hypothetical protein
MLELAEVLLDAGLGRILMLEVLGAGALGLAVYVLLRAAGKGPGDEDRRA